jgi:hypothetical protein
MGRGEGDPDGQPAGKESRRERGPDHQTARWTGPMAARFNQDRSSGNMVTSTR